MSEGRGEAGFGLLEALLALLLLATFALVLLELLADGARGLAASDRRLVESRLATLALDLARLDLDPAVELAPWLPEGMEVRLERRPHGTASGRPSRLEELVVVIADAGGERLRLASLAAAR
ncbi:hypothetical protein HRbin40_02506 [bacterium HR40]|nr:hypothetical protein HRbin40_02506 [bacterium HR40]